MCLFYTDYVRLCFLTCSIIVLQITQTNSNKTWVPWSFINIISSMWFPSLRSAYSLLHIPINIPQHFVQSNKERIALLIVKTKKGYVHCWVVILLLFRDSPFLQTDISLYLVYVKLGFIENSSSTSSPLLFVRNLQNLSSTQGFVSQDDLVKAVDEYCDDPNEWTNSAQYATYGWVIFLQ